MSLLPLRPHQKETIDRMRGLNYFLDLSDPGTGKTRVQVDALAERLQNGLAEKSTLVLSTKTSLYSTWFLEFQKWQPHITCSIATANVRKKAFQKNAHVYITNHDAATWLANQPSKFFEKFDTLIVDEITAFKNPIGTKRTKAMLQIAEYFKYRFGLTGTPLPNTLADIWSQVYLIDLGDALGGSYYQFRAQVCNPIQLSWANPHAKKWVAKDGAKEAVASLIAPFSIRHEETDLPENIMFPRMYKMNNKTRKIYKELKEQSMLAIQDNFVIGTNAAALLQKLLQACSGAVYSELGDSVTLDNERCNLVADLVKERQHCVVFFQWKHQRDNLIKTFKKEKISFCLIDGTVTDNKRDKVITDFQAGKYKVCLAHPQAAAHSITLTRATTTIWASLTYNLEHFKQANKRIHRMGQKHKTQTIVVMAEDTVEKRVYDRLREKDATQQSVLDTIKELTQ